jgi:quinol monooxygenase YgiN
MGSRSGGQRSNYTNRHHAHMSVPWFFTITGINMNTSAIESFISLVGTYEIDPLDAAAFATIATASIDEIVNKPGCLYYVASRDLKQPNVFHLAEGWATQADLDAHIASPGFQEMLEQAFKLRIVRREIYLSESTGRTLMG